LGRNMKSDYFLRSMDHLSKKKGIHKIQNLGHIVLNAMEGESWYEWFKGRWSIEICQSLSIIVYFTLNMWSYIWGAGGYWIRPDKRWSQICSSFSDGNWRNCHCYTQLCVNEQITMNLEMIFCHTVSEEMYKQKMTGKWTYYSEFSRYNKFCLKFSTIALSLCSILRYEKMRFPEIVSLMIELIVIIWNEWEQSIRISCSNLTQWKPSHRYYFSN
jgi:hypothetical protein